jgi:heterodisulfide reductase subunit C
MAYISNILFALLLISGIGFFVYNIKSLIANIKLGNVVAPISHKSERLKNMLLIAFGQSKMIKRPVAGILHIIVYLGFIIINIEVIEIIIDGLFGTHRIFSGLGFLYTFLINSFEVLAILVLISVVIFWLRRNVTKIKRFLNPEMQGWPKSDGNYILYFEVVLMMLFLLMNATDLDFQSSNSGNVISQFIYPFFINIDQSNLHIIERICWWLHISGILVFLNYLYYSKHLHILLAFPNTYLGSVSPKGQFDNLSSVTNEVKLMLDPSADPYAPSDNNDEVLKFGASDVFDLNQLQLLNAYTCTECGRCTSVCPANQTGKQLSPRKIMMDTRDRLEEVGKNIRKNSGAFKNDNKHLLDNYITREELWACTSCNACVEECPVSINPLSIILDMRRYLVMEESSAPAELNVMMTNIENNGAPWPFNQMDRLNWKND